MYRAIGGIYHRLFIDSDEVYPKYTPHHSPKALTIMKRRAAGIGSSPHLYRYIWPIALAVGFDRTIGRKTSDLRPLGGL